MIKATSILLGAILGTLIGAIIWGTLFSALGYLLNGFITFQPFGVVRIDGLSILALKLGIIMGSVQGLLTGLLIGTFNPVPIKGSLYGFLVTQTCILTTVPLVIWSAALRPASAPTLLETIFNYIVEIISWWMLFTTIFSAQSSITGYVAARIFNPAVSKFNLSS